MPTRIHSFINGDLSFLPAGLVFAFAGTSAPTGSLLCDASAVSRTTYEALFAAIGTSCGSGNGSTTFNLPDYRGRALRGVDGAAGRDPDSSSRTAMNSGGNTGNNVGSVQAGQYASHNHNTSSDGTHTHEIRSEWGTNAVNVTAPNGSYNQLDNDDSYINTTSVKTNGSAHNHTITSSGGNETRMINAYVNFIITTGV